jgi:hypothetical protein
MMEVSDNMSTLAVSNHFGLANIDATAGALGMTSTSVNFTIGCQGPTPESTLTLRDLTTLHEAVANGYLGNQRATFYDLMAESLTFPSWGTEDLNTRINAEARVHGLSYSKLIAGLNLAGLEIDRKVLADIAMNDPAAFGVIAQKAKDSLLKQAA